MEHLESPQAGMTPRWRRWMVEHDDSWVFVISYLGLAVVLTLFISLFWLVVLVAVHALLEWVRQQDSLTVPGQPVPRRLIAAHCAWEVKLDVALLFLALALSAYMTVLLGLAGLGQAARAGAQGGTRVLVWARVLRGVLLTVDEGAQVARVGFSKFAARKRQLKASDDAAGVGHQGLAPWRRWGVGDHIAIWLGLASIIAICVAPLITDLSMQTVLRTIASELHPFPSDQ